MIQVSLIPRTTGRCQALAGREPDVRRPRHPAAHDYAHARPQVRCSRLHAPRARPAVDGTKGSCADGDVLRGATAIAMSPDAKNVYVASYASGGIAVFARDAVTGKLKIGRA